MKIERGVEFVGECAGLMTIEVGGQSPFDAPGAGQSALAVTLTHGILTMICQLPDVVDDDIVSITATPLGLALLQTDELPIGVMLLVLGDAAEAAWPLAAPIVPSEAAMRAWVEEPLESNVVMVMLVDSNTNVVRALRTIGAPIAFLEQLRAGMRSCEVVDVAAFTRGAGALPSEAIWQDGSRWMLDRETGEFEER